MNQMKQMKRKQKMKRLTETDNIQDFFISLGNNSCYVLALIEAGMRIKGEKGIDLFFQNLERAIDSRYIFFDEKNYLNGNNFFVKDAENLLRDIFGGKWQVVKTYSEYHTSDFENIIVYSDEYGNKHFRLADWDSVKKSLIAKKGFIDSYRIIHFVGFENENIQRSI